MPVQSLSVDSRQFRSVIIQRALTTFFQLEDALATVADSLFKPSFADFTLSNTTKAHLTILPPR
jgi:hypothetical protein